MDDINETPEDIDALITPEFNEWWEKEGQFIRFGDGKDLSFCYVCEDARTGNRQIYSESMLVGDPDYNQALGRYEKEEKDTNAQ